MEHLHDHFEAVAIVLHFLSPFGRGRFETANSLRSANTVLVVAVVAMVEQAPRRVTAALGLLARFLPVVVFRSSGCAGV